MAVHYRTQGFVLKAIDRGEANQLLTIYTKEYGKLNILGKAIRKIKSKLRGGIELFSLSEIEFIQGKTNKTLTDAVLIEKFPNIKKDLAKLEIAHKVAEVMDKLIKGQEKDLGVWQLLNEVFEKLNKQKPEIIYYYFFWNIVSILGYQPEIYKCSICQKKLFPGLFYFSLEKGGVACRNCVRQPEQSQIVNQDFIKILRIFISRDWKILSRLKINSNSLKLLKNVSGVYLNEILEKNWYNIKT